MTALPIGDEVPVAPLLDDRFRIRPMRTALFPLHQVRQAAVHQVFGDGPPVRDELQASPAHRGIGPLLDHLIIVRQGALAAADQLPHVADEKTWMTGFDLVGGLPLNAGSWKLPR
jgi:hypothetical protein